MNPSGTLGAVFLASCVQRDIHQAIPLDDLEIALERQVASGQKAWPELPLASFVFVSHMAERTRMDVPLIEAVAKLHGSDLYLACACLHGLPGALAEFDKQYIRRVPAAIARINPSPDFISEVCQRLRARLLLSAPAHRARIADYAGTGALLNWLRAAAVRLALDLHRQDGRAPSVIENDLEAQMAQAQLSPELQYLKAQYGEGLRAAMHQARAALSDEDDNLLDLYFSKGLSLENIGVLFGVNRSTVYRRLQRVLAGLYREIRRLVRQQLRLSASEFKSLVNLLLSRLELQVPPS